MSIVCDYSESSATIYKKLEILLNFDSAHFIFLDHNLQDLQA